jgi:hypothetical protein
MVNVLTTGKVVTITHISPRPDGFHRHITKCVRWGQVKAYEQWEICDEIIYLPCSD